ncbi:hypothetical protein [Actinophytocola glycyrrhizae]|uniref:Uncharacterized protein n=1 Tax=Actinophytocola glycyrrhizae TaxID=2044873 RepID=A0ABV9RVA9_9PSEU
MGETDPAQILPARKQVTETNVSAPAGTTPMMPPMGMPMSHQPATPGEPRGPADTDDVPDLPADTVAEPFGAPLAVTAHEAVTPVIPATMAETVVPRTFERLEPGITAEPATPLEPRGLLARTTPAEGGIEPLQPLESSRCRCCGDTHDGQEDRPFERGHDRAHDGEPRLDDDGAPTRDAVRDNEPRLVHDDVPSGDPAVPAGYGEPRGLERAVKPAGDVTDPVPTNGESDSCCCCCGDHHDFDRASGDTATGVPVIDDQDDPAGRGEHEDDDRCGPDGDEQRPGRHGNEHGDDHGDRYGGKGDGKHDDEDDCRHDGKHDGKGDGKHDPDSRGDGTPRDERARKSVNERPVTEPETAYAVRHRAPDATKHTPGETMAPPPRANRLEKLADSGPGPGKPAQSARLVSQKPASTTSSVPAGQTVPAAQLVPAAQFVPAAPPNEDDTSPSKPAETARGYRMLAPTPVPTESGTPPPVPLQPVVTTPRPQQDGSGNPPVPPPTEVNSQSTPAYRTTAVPAVVGSPESVGANPHTSPFTLGGTNGQTTVPPADGNVGPDPNVKFDEGQYNQLINVIADVEAGVFDSVVMGDVYLGTELKLQPSGQKWPPAVDLVNKGSGFGGSVDTQNTSLGDSLSSFHDALEEAKAVFKNTDDLAAYDATKFTTEYPGFNGGLPGA